jgi:uncharacterized protein YbaP (TraB family)
MKRSVRVLLSVCGLAFLSAGPVWGGHSITVQAQDGDEQVQASIVDAPNTVIALVQATSACEAKRALKGVSAKCEPVLLNKERISTAAQLRTKALAESPKLSLFHLQHENASVYLYGSVHLMKENIYPLDSKIMAAFNASEALALEVDLARLSSREINSRFTQAGILPAAQSLQEKLSPATLKLLQQALDDRGLDLNAYARMRPWMFEQSFIAQEMMLYGFGAGAGIDAFFAGRARLAGKTILELESLDEQLALISSATLEEQDDSLRYMLEALGQDLLQEEVNSLVIDWLQGDVEGIYASMMAPLAKYPGLAPYMKRMFDDRNLAMAEKIAAWIKRGGSYFVVVGAGHLGGPKGLVELMRARGFKLTQLSR